MHSWGHLCQPRTHSALRHAGPDPLGSLVPFLSPAWPDGSGGTAVLFLGCRRPDGMSDLRVGPVSLPAAPWLLQLPSSSADELGRSGTGSSLSPSSLGDAVTADTVHLDARIPCLLLIHPQVGQGGRAEPPVLRGHAPASELRAVSRVGDGHSARLDTRT